MRAGREFARALALAPLLFACRQDMASQPRYNPLAESDFFGDDRSARPLSDDTVARGHLRDESLLFTGKIGGAFADAFPFPVDEASLRRGRERFEIYCAPCHGRAGRGDGMVVQRGYRQPPSFHTDRLRQQPAGYFFDVIVNGFGAMPDYAAQIDVKDRWRIVAYVRALQLSEHAGLEDVPEERRKALDAGPKP
jgi:mono/diheme cytochrome c family protein